MANPTTQVNTLTGVGPDAQTLTLPGGPPTARYVLHFEGNHTEPVKVYGPDDNTDGLEGAYVVPPKTPMTLGGDYQAFERRFLPKQVVSDTGVATDVTITVARI